MSQNLNDRPDRSPVLVGHCGSSAMMEQMLVLGIMEAMKSPGGQILVARGCQPSFVHLDEFPFYLEEDHPQHGCRVIDESGPWPPVPVDPIVAKHRDIRIAKAEAKRQRKNLKRLKAAGRV